MSVTGRLAIRCETPGVIGESDDQDMTNASTLASAHLARYEHGGAPSDLDRAVQLAGLSLEQTPEPGMARLRLLASALSLRWCAAGDRSDLTKLVELLRGAGVDDAAVVSVGDETGAAAAASVAALSDLAVVLRYRYEHLGEPADLDRGITHLREAVRLAPAGSPALPRYLGELGLALRLRHDRAGDPNDLDAGLRVFELITRSADGPAALAVAPEHRGEQARLLLDRFERDGDAADLDHALALLEQAVEELPERAPQRAVLLNDSGLCLRVRFEHRGRIADLDSATTAFRLALELAAPGAPHRVTYLENLANCLIDWYRVDDDLTRLDQAVVTLTDALGWLPDDSPQRPRVLANLAGALWHRWTENRADRDREAVIGILRGVVDEVGPARARWLSNLAMALESRYHDRGEAVDLAEATAMYRKVCEFAAPATCAEQSGDARWSLLAARYWGRWAMDRAAWAEAAQAHAFGRAAARCLVATQNRRWLQDEWLLQASGLAVESAMTSVALGDLGAAVLALEQGRGLVLSEAFTVESVDLVGLAAAGHPGLAAQYQVAANQLAALTRIRFGTW